MSLEFRMMFSAILAAIILIPLLLAGTEYGYLGNDGSHVTLGRTLYWSCVVGAFYGCWKLKFNFDFGTIVACLLGPYTLLITGFFLLSLKIWPIKQSNS